MSFKRLTLAATAALALSTVVASAQVGGGSIGGNGTVGGGGSVGGATIGGTSGSGNAGSSGIGNQSPAPGSPVLPNAANGASSSSQIDRTPGAASGNSTANGAATTGTEGVERTPAPAVTPPQSIIDQPVAPNIPAPNQPNSDPANLNLQTGQSSTSNTSQ